MACDLLKKTRWLALASMFALAAGVSSTACSSASADDGSNVAVDDITQVNHSKVKRQSIGNCWLYATTSWLEALNKAATNREQNTSESWLTYWHWYEQIANGSSASEILAGGTFRTAANLITRYGITLEGDFIAGEAQDERSNRQKTALDAINLSLKSGALKDSAARRDRKLVRKELDRAWALDADVTTRIDAVFGEDVSRTLDRSTTAASKAAQNRIITPKSFAARLKDPATGQFVNVTLADAIGTDSSWWRQGRLAWHDVDYPSDARGRRKFWKRVQKALHDGMPVITSWTVDFNALTRDSRFSKDALDGLGPGRQGAHVTVMHDYQAEVPGIGLLKAGQQATPEQMTKALADGTKIQFVRVKNSWGGIRPDRWDDAVLPGYQDLEMSYLNGPIKECVEVNGHSDPTNCPFSITPLRNVTLPAGY